MAAYAALVSLEHIIHNLQLHHHPPIFLHKEQAHLLTEKLTFLQQFLQIYNPNLPYSKEADPLESRIARAAYAAEDSIESHILDRFKNNGEKTSSYSLYEALEKVIQDMTMIERESTVVFRNQLHPKSTPDSSISPSSSIARIKRTMVGADDLLLELKSMLTADARDLQTLPVVGMGGSGKTTLALNIYQDRLIVEHFEVRAWVTISQEYSIREILKQLLTQLKEDSTVGEFGEILHKHLYGRKYMIILDDMWSIDAWDAIKRSLPDNKNGSRVVITTRLITLASTLPKSNILGMKLLDENDSWDLLLKTVFGKKGCPLGFEDIGKKIGKSCKGLPLSIIVIGGLLAQSERSLESWKHVEENLNEIVNLEDDERCLKILYMSYKQLPVHLKPCFLYMGIYREDHEIRISNLIRLWVAEGFLKPVSGKRPEDVARLYLKDLIDRNLILIHKLASTGSIKECKVHDLLRDMCLREAQKEGFYTVYAGHEIEDRVSRVVMSPEIKEIGGMSSVPRARSLILDLDRKDVTTSHSQALRIVGSGIASNKSLDNVHRLVNSRYFTLNVEDNNIHSSIWLFWNLHTLVINLFWYERMIASTDIWYMSHLRHLQVDRLNLPDPPNGQDGIVLTNLQTLGWITGFTCSEQMVKRIPNIRKLKIIYESETVDDRFCLTNLDCFDKLESLNCHFDELKCLINYPRSLEKLSVRVDRSQQYCWQDDALDKIGALPLLQKLKLYYGTFQGKWETTEGQFRSLKFLSLVFCKGLQVWTSEASHFPKLEQLHLYRADDLKEIPSDFTEISTLRLIDVAFCQDVVVESAKKILEEQEALYGEQETTLQIQVQLYRNNNPSLKSFRSPNFHFI